MQSLLNAIEDGTWHEGIPYQNYGLAMLLPFLVNLRWIQGIDLLPHPYLRNYARWRLYNLLTGSSEFIMSYGNFEWFWANDYGPAGLLRFVANEYDDGYAEWVAQQRIAVDGRFANQYSTPWYVFEFLYYDPALPARIPSGLPPARVFPDLEGVIWRTGWEESDLVFGFKTGPSGGRHGYTSFTEQLYPWACLELGCQMNVGHDHDDGNGFYLYRAGRWLAPETVGYNGAESSLHNVILIDGQGQSQPPQDAWRDPEAFADRDGYLLATAETAGFHYVAADVTQRYATVPDLKDVTRHVLFVRNRYFVMLDQLAAAGAHGYEWVSHVGEQVTVEDRWVRGEAGDGQILGIGVVVPRTFTTTVGHDGQPFVHVRPQSPRHNMRFINVLYPTDAADWDERPDLTLLADTGAAAAVRIAHDQGSGWSDDVMINYTRAYTPVAVGPYVSDALVAVVSTQSGQPTKLFLSGGTSLIDRVRKRTLVTGIGLDEPFEADFDGSTVDVVYGGAGEVELHAPGATRLRVNGTPHSFVRVDDRIIFAPNSDQLAWTAGQAEIAPPFVLEEGSIYRSAVHSESPADAGRASFRFAIGHPGRYSIIGLVDAPNDGSDSFWVTIDQEPADERAIWHIEQTTGYEERVVLRPEDGDATLFAFDAGDHEIIVRGREKNTRLRGIRLERAPDRLYLPLIQFPELRGTK